MRTPLLTTTWARTQQHRLPVAELPSALAQGQFTSMPFTTGEPAIVFDAVSHTAHRDVSGE